MSLQPHASQNINTCRYTTTSIYIYFHTQQTVWRYPEGQQRYSNWARFTLSLTLPLLHSRFNTAFFMLIFHQSTHL